MKLYSTDSETLLAAISALKAATGTNIPDKAFFGADAPRGAYMQWWKDNLADRYQKFMTMNAYATFVERILAGHEAIHKGYSARDAYLRERSKICGWLADGTPWDEAEPFVRRMITGWNQQAISAAKRLDLLQQINLRLKRLNHEGQLSVLSNEYDRAGTVIKSMVAEIFTHYPSHEEAIDGFKAAFHDLERESKAAEYLAHQAELKAQQVTSSAVREHYLQPQIDTLNNIASMARKASHEADMRLLQLTDQAKRLKLHALRKPRVPLESPVWVRFDETMIWIELADGRTVGAPMSWHPRLAHAKKADREKYMLSAVAVEWPGLRLELHMDDLFDGENRPLHPLIPEAQMAKSPE